MSPHKIYISVSRQSGIIFADGKYLIPYMLAEPFHFQEPHYARLLGFSKATGTGSTSLEPSHNLYIDFVKKSDVDGVLKPLLGVSSPYAENTWVPLSSNYIPSFGHFQVERASGNPLQEKLPAGTVWFILIEVASESWVHGATVKTAV